MGKESTDTSGTAQVGGAQLAARLRVCACLFCPSHHATMGWHEMLGEQLMCFHHPGVLMRELSNHLSA